MVDTSDSTTKTAYLIIQPLFYKVVKTILSCETVEQLDNSERYIDNFLTFIEETPTLINFPVGISRAILSSYYGAEIRRIYVSQAMAINSRKS